VARQRISFRFEAESHTVEGHLLNFLREHKLLNHRDAVLRATKAFYLPWVYEGELPKEDVKALARSAVEELEYRIFQIRKHFLADELGEPSLPSALDVSTSTPIPPDASPVTKAEVGSEESGTSQPSVKPADKTPEAIKRSVEEVMPTNLDPSVLDDF
jgi:hypothetical protein